MFREIKKRQIILENRKPYGSEVCAYIDELNMLDWIHSSMRLDGNSLSRLETERILRGEFIKEVTLNEHALVERHHNLFRETKDMFAISCSFNKDMLFRFANLLTGERACYRRENPVLIAFNYNPPHPAEIDEQIDLLMNWFYTQDVTVNPIMKAVCLHHKIIEIYPFDLCSEAVARAAMYYFLMEKGYPAFDIGMSEQAYNKAVMDYLKREDADFFYREAEQSIFRKMEVLMQLTMPQ